ncbi:hypothetical protein ACFVZH_28805 [Streptomyces sp. NPDC059534]|uniref:hypothetical protein n=1 Tax=Streptomyces sp. NPDC059534 TaxID=3346859 RepID=UPI0036B18B2C
MTEVEHSEDPEPSERVPAGPLLVLAPGVSEVPGVWQARGDSKVRGVVKARGDEGSWRTWDPQRVGVLRVVGAAAVISCIDLLIG